MNRLRSLYTHDWLKIIHILIVSFIVSSCNQENRKPKLNEQEIKKIKENLIGVHRYLIGKDADSINKYLADIHFKMEQTERGLWYKIYKVGSKDSIKPGDYISFEYTVSLLNDKLCYSSDSLGQKSFVVGRGGVESGIEEGVLLMSKGDSAIFILPPYLAHGVGGDGDKIPRFSILKYRMFITDVVKNNSK